MSKHEHTADDRNERMSPEVYRELGKHGAGIPQSEQEVRAAEDWVSKSQERLPERLNELPEQGRQQAPGRLLDRYLQPDPTDRSVEDTKSLDDDRSNRDLDRE